MIVTRRKHHLVVDGLQKAIKTLRIESEGHRQNSKAYQAEAREWRERYELALLTPEVKADTEAAFKRGETVQRKKFGAWLQQQASSLLSEGVE